ncbi:MAG: ribonuclease III [Anaerolineales bacterium]
MPVQDNPDDLNKSLLETPESLSRRLQLPFSNLLHLQRALTHRSYLNEYADALEDNERLEFLGDAVLDFLVAAWLYNRYPEMKEGELTRLRAALVGTEQLAAFARRLNLGLAMRLGRGENEGGGRKRDSLLCATFEAVVGALFVDVGLDAVYGFVEPLLEPAIEEILAERYDLDHKSYLQEWSQFRGYGIPHYKLVAVSGPDHERNFEFEVSVDGTVYGRGVGSNKQAASKEAAREALIALGVGS